MSEESDSLRIAYREHSQIERMVENIQHVLECISVDFDKWDEPYAHGPGLYIAIVAGTSLEEYADPMGDNVWPVEECPTVGDVDAMYEVATDVGAHCDGAVVVSADGAIQQQMVRFRDSSSDTAESADPEYADWMGSRHMSAVDTTLNDEVVCALTLSEETGRVTLFENGSYEDQTRDEISSLWRAD